MVLSEKVLKHHLKTARQLVSFIDYCIAQQRHALRAEDEPRYLHWIKEARKARKELSELYRIKEQHDQETERIKRIVQNMQSRGIDCEIVKRAHELTDEDLAQ